MTQWFEQVLAQACKVESSGWLAQPRQAALAKLKQQKWPTRKTEAWRFTSLTPVEGRQAIFESSSVVPNIPTISNLACIDIVFNAGELITDLSALILPEGLKIHALSQSSAADSVGERYASIKPDSHLFGLINDSVASAGVIVDIAANANITTPIRLVHIASEGVDNHSRVFVSVGESAKATVIEHGDGEQDSMNTAFAEFDIAQNAKLEHYRFAFFTQRALHAGGSHFRLAESSYLNSTVVGYGSVMSRLNIDVIYSAENANAEINAIYLLAEGENFDLQTTIEHAVPNCTTEENVRGIVGERAKANFNGRIHIHRYAQKTLAELNNRNLLLSRRGQINTKPELEIYADDVKCAHGATIAEIDEKALYYLLSRGIPRSKALVMLNFGFVQELVDKINHEDIQTWLSDLLRNRFSTMEVK